MRLTPVMPPPMTRTSARGGSSPGYRSGAAGQYGVPVLMRAPGPARTVGSGDRIPFRCHMDFESYDVLVVGGGLAGIRAAIAVVETNPRLKVALVSKVYPMRSHTEIGRASCRER